MAKVTPFQSKKQTVQHNNNSCNEGSYIEKENCKSGTGGKALCGRCRRILEICFMSGFYIFVMNHPRIS